MKVIFFKHVQKMNLTKWFTLFTKVFFLYFLHMKCTVVNTIQQVSQILLVRCTLFLIYMSLYISEETLSHWIWCTFEHTQNPVIWLLFWHICSIFPSFPFSLVTNQTFLKGFVHATFFPKTKQNISKKPPPLSPRKKNCAYC